MAEKMPVFALLMLDKHTASWAQVVAFSSMERISLNGRAVPGFSLGQDASKETVKFAVTPAVAAVSVGVTAGLLAAVLHAPLWGTIVAGCAGALVTKVGIDKSAEKMA